MSRISRAIRPTGEMTPWYFQGHALPPGVSDATLRMINNLGLPDDAGEFKSWLVAKAFETGNTRLIAAGEAWIRRTRERS